MAKTIFFDMTQTLFVYKVICSPSFFHQRNYFRFTESADVRWLRSKIQLLQVRQTNMQQNLRFIPTMSTTPNREQYIRPLLSWKMHLQWLLSQSATQGKILSVSRFINLPQLSTSVRPPSIKMFVFLRNRERSGLRIAQHCDARVTETIVTKLQLIQCPAKTGI